MDELGSLITPLYLSVALVEYSQILVLKIPVDFIQPLGGLFDLG